MGRFVSAPGNPANISLENVRTFWLHTNSETESKYLLLEDSETGDVLMPLIYMKAILEANYSRKLASLKHRVVKIPENNSFSDQQGLMYWQWAFESSHAIKVLVRREIGESSPQGHLRLVLVPIVYNALAMRSEFRDHPLFLALHRVMRISNYWSMLLHPAPDVLATLDQETGVANIQHPSQMLFRGPKMFESTAMKYMFMFKSLEELEASKRTRTTAAPSQDQILPVQAVHEEESGGPDVENGTGEQSGSLQGGLGDILTLNQSAGSLPQQERNLSQSVPVPFTTDQLKTMMDSKVHDILREISTIKTSIVGMMNYLVSSIVENHSPVQLTDDHYHKNASTAPDLMHYDHEAFAYSNPSGGKVHQYSAGQGRFSPYPTVSTGQQVGSRNNSLSLRSPINITGSARTEVGRGLPPANSHQGEDVVDLRQAYSLLQTMRNSSGTHVESHVIPRDLDGGHGRMPREDEHRRDRMAVTVNRENDHLIIPQGSASRDTRGGRLLSDDERTEST
eukprot:jgi/Picsp_1/3695/NSC_06532-R1_hypothetical protein CHLNCDRAFT_49352 [Chlorella variabilis]